MAFKSILRIHCLVFLFLSAFCRVSLADSILNSKHNLSISGPGTIKAQSENQVCVFCHTPHNAFTEAPLWNRFDSGQVYNTYTSSTLSASVGQPSGSSKLCLSCHDGTVALGMVSSRWPAIPFVGGVGVLPAGNTNLGTDLSDDHPVSFVYDAGLVGQNPELKNPGTLTGAVQLDQGGSMQCISCHDPHDNVNGKFLTVTNQFSNLCLNCHDKSGWNFSSHKLSNAIWNGTSTDPWFHTEWTTVAENACENCHGPHNTQGTQRLLNYVVEESVCLVCHNGNVAQTDINTAFNKMSAHPISNTIGIHDPTEETLLAGSRHVECMDCHNPHAVNDQDSTVPGSLSLVRGIDINGSEVDPINNEYQLCFRCHADSAQGSPYVNREYPETNTRLEFAPSNPSYHPVAAIGKNPNVPSLINPYTTSSIINCTACHNNNSGPNGPHGSNFAPILERQQIFADNQEESLQTYALCYKCHSQESIKRDESFGEHDRHVRNNNTPCTACHDPHGSTNNTHLINFDRNIVSPNSQGVLNFVDLGTFTGTCSLNCHGEEHNNRLYPR